MELIGAFIFFVFLGAFAGTFGAAVLGAIAAFLTRGMKQGRGAILVGTGAFSYACAGWVAVIFLGQALSSQDDLLPLPNGYAIRLDEGDHNLLLNLKTQMNGRYGTAEASDTATDVSELQLAGPYMLGAADHLGSSLGRDRRAKIYFLLDTRTGRSHVFGDANALSASARKAGLQLGLEPLSSVYSRYSFNLRTLWVPILAVAPPAVATLFWLIWILRRRRL